MIMPGSVRALVGVSSPRFLTSGSEPFLQRVRLFLNAITQLRIRRHTEHLAVANEHATGNRHETSVIAAKRIERSRLRIMDGRSAWGRERECSEVGRLARLEAADAIGETKNFCSAKRGKTQSSVRREGVVPAEARPLQEYS